jgi:hypothetical protein
MRPRAIVAAALLAAAFLSAPFEGALVVRDARSHRILAAFPARRGDLFELGYTHSVNKGAVVDRLRIGEDGALTVESSVFESFGAGMSDGLEPSVTMRVTAAGIELEGLNHHIGSLGLAVGTVANHWLRVGGTKVALAEVAEPGSFVNIDFGRIAPGRAILERMRHERH